MAKSLGARVTGLHVVVDTLVAAGIGKSLRDPDEPVKAAEQYLHEIFHQAALAGVPCECVYVVGTWSHEELVKAAQTKGCDLIHMASQGKGMIAGPFLGRKQARWWRKARCRCWCTAEFPVACCRTRTTSAAERWLLDDIGERLPPR